MYLPSKSLEIPTIVSTLLVCGLITMLQRDALLEFVAQNSKSGERIALRFSEKATAIQVEATSIEALAARRGVETMVARRVTAMRYLAISLQRKALDIKARTEKVDIGIKEERIPPQGQTLPRAA